MTSAPDLMAPARRQLLARTAAAYMDLESRVRSRVAAACSSLCSGCPTPCCREPFCAETIHSPWLERVRDLGSPGPGPYHPENGWLAADGCRLTAGRPPLCYDFFCNRILHHPDLPVGPERLTRIAGLVSGAGHRALGQRHLVTLSAGQIARRLDLNRLQRRIAACRHQLEALAISPGDG